MKFEIYYHSMNSHWLSLCEKWLESTAQAQKLTGFDVCLTNVDYQVVGDMRGMQKKMAEKEAHYHLPGLENNFFSLPNDLLPLVKPNEGQRGLLVDNLNLMVSNLMWLYEEEAQVKSHLDTKILEPLRSMIHVYDSVLILSHIVNFDIYTFSGYGAKYQKLIQYANSKLSRTMDRISELPQVEFSECVLMNGFKLKTERSA